MSFDLKTALESKSDEYEEFSPKWLKCNTLYKGEDKVHEVGEALLPRLPSQDDDEYLVYVERTRLLNAFKRTVKGLEGTVNNKEPETELESIKEFLDDIDTAGTTIDEYANELLHEAVKIGVCGTLVDHNDSIADGDEPTVAQSEENNNRPKLSFYVADSIYKARYGMVNGSKQLVFVVLKEEYDLEDDNEFINETKDQYRVLRLNEAGEYEQQVYRVDVNDTIEEGEPIVPMMDGNPLASIPFFIHGKYEEPPLYDLVTNNVKHYQLKADHNRSLHVAGCAQPYRLGVDPNDKNLPTTMGSTVIWDIENENATIGYLELEGKSIGAIVTELDTIKEDMAFSGAANLVSDQMVNETATKANLRNAAETSSLVELVGNLSHTFTKALQLFSLWSGGSDDVYYHYNQDYDITKLTAQEILARVQGWQSGAYSKRSLFKQLKDGEVELASETFEEEEELITKGE